MKKVKNVEIDLDLYQYIASQTNAIGKESPSDILRRLLNFPACLQTANEPKPSDQLPLFSQPETQEPPVKKHATNQLAVNLLTKNVKGLLKSDEFKQENKGVNRFLQVLSVLYRTNPESFATAVESIKGSTREYFAREEGILLAIAKTCKPKQIPASPFWVVTNNNTDRKLRIIGRTMAQMQLPETVIQDVESAFNEL